MSVESANLPFEKLGRGGEGALKSGCCSDLLGSSKLDKDGYGRSLGSNS